MITLTLLAHALRAECSNVQNIKLTFWTYYKGSTYHIMPLQQAEV